MRNDRRHHHCQCDRQQLLRQRGFDTVADGVPVKVMLVDAPKAIVAVPLIAAVGSGFMVAVTVAESAKQLLDTLYLMVAVPAATANKVPPALTLATDAALVDHVPPAEVLLSVEEPPMQSVVVPDNVPAVTVGTTVTVALPVIELE